ncbi:MAG: FlgN [Verrucomicrobiales bacterium]|nr:FlgN [Verrucomicrobiales bacterium]
MKTESLLQSILPKLVEALRQELREYGEMLALLDQQREHVIARNGTEVIQAVAAINQQAETIRMARTLREQAQQEVARALQKANDSSITALLPFLPENQRFTVSALMRENNDLMARVQQRARQNHLLLSRSLELMQRFINTLVPAASPATYTGTGQIQPRAVPPQPIYEAIG